MRCASRIFGSAMRVKSCDWASVDVSAGSLPKHWGLQVVCSCVLTTCCYFTPHFKAVHDTRTKSTRILPPPTVRLAHPQRESHRSPRGHVASRTSMRFSPRMCQADSKAAGWSHGRFAIKQDVFGLRGQGLRRQELGEEQVLLQAVEH